MEIYQLRTFLAVAELGHLTRAADRLHISQPAVSGQIRALEEELELDLFERTPAGMALTGAGRKLLPYAEEIIRAAGQMRAAAESYRGRLQGGVRLATVSDPGYLRVGQFLAQLMERHPLIDVELHQESSGEVLEQILAGELDAGFYFGEAPKAPLEGMRLTDMTYRVIVPREWAGRIETADWPDMAALPWVLTPPNSSHRHMIAEAFESRGLEPQRAVEADQESVIANLVSSGVGVSLAREDLALAGAHAGRWLVWQPARLKTTLWFVYPAKEAHSPVLKAVLEVLAELWEGGQPAVPGEAKAPAEVKAPPSAPKESGSRPSKALARSAR
ncbi:MAG TPA: LysR family transcriptional regulator [Burkholderiales bacterium]|nr:LysR family transcriptional regulator [Burkholderiales bacterium]